MKIFRVKWYVDTAFNGQLRGQLRGQTRVYLTQKRGIREEVFKYSFPD